MSGPALPSPEVLPRGRSAAWMALAAALVWLAWMLGTLVAEPMARALQDHSAMALALFVLSTAAAVVMPIATNLPLVPAAVQLWGPWGTAAALLGGWVLGSWLAFVLGRLVRLGWLTRAPGLPQVTDIDRWIHPRHRLASLVWLRISFPLDVLSFALGLFSARTTLWQLLLSTALGGAPFALLFAFAPRLPWWAQALLLGGCTLLFLVYAAWMRRARPGLA